MRIGTGSAFFPQTHQEEDTVRFQATIEPAGDTATGIEVPVEVVELGCGRKPPIRVTIRHHTFRSTVASRRGRYLAA